MELPLDREDVQTILGSLFDANRKLDDIVMYIFLERTMKKKKKPIQTPELRARYARTMKMLEERIAYHERKAAEEKKSA